MTTSVEPMEEGPSSPGPPPLQDQNGMEVTAPVQKSKAKVSAEVASRKRTAEKRRLDVTELNPHIQCQLCKGYLINPVTVVECLHSFCKSCIIRHVETSKTCPVCDIQIHKTKPLLSLRADKALQDIVYKVVPGLYRTEMQNRVKFYTKHPDAEPANSEDAGEVADSLFFSPEDEISMSIEYFDNISGNDVSKNGKDNKGNAPDNLETENPNRRFLQCPGSVTVNHLKKFIITKYGLDDKFVVDVIYRDDLLAEDNTLIDVAYSYNWRKTSPMRFYYRIYQKTKVLTRKRKSKKTKTNSKGQPSKKRRNIESAEVASGVAPRTSENGMEIEEESRKASSNLRTDSGEERVKTKASKEKPKVDSAKVKLSLDPAKPVKGSSKGGAPALPKAGEGKTNIQSKPVNGKPTSVGKPVQSGKLMNGAKPVPQVKPVPGAKPAQGAKLVPGAKPVVSHPVKAAGGKVGQSKPVSSQPSSQSAGVKPVTAKPVSSVPGKAGLSTGKSATEEKSAPSKARTTPPAEPPVSKPPVASSVKTTTTNSTSSSDSKKVQKKEKETPPPTSDVLTSDQEKPAAQTNGSNKQAAKETKVAPRKGDAKVKPAAETSPASNTLRQQQKNAAEPASNNKAAAGEKEVVEISVEVSASDVKKVLEKKKAEKDAARLTSNGEEKLYSNYSIVDQLKKGAAAASLARQKQASMMDFTRSSEALNAPKVPPTIQGLQPKVTSSGETNVLSAIVHSLAQKQQSLNQKIQAVTGKPEQGKEKRETVSPGLKLKDSSTEGTKTLGTILAPGLTKSQNGLEKLPKGNSNGTIESPASSKRQLPTSTSIKPIEPRKSPAPVDTTGSKGQQMLNFYKNNFPKTSSEDEVKSTETLTRNIPAGTTVTVKTVDNRSPRSSPSSTGASKTSSFSSSSSSAFRMNLSNSVGKQQQPPSSLFGATSTPSSPLIPPFMPSPLTMALAAQQQYLNFSNQHAALTAQMEAANYIKAMQAAQAISTTPVTSLAFTKPVTSSGLKIPQPPMSGFGTSRLQLKVNQDSPPTMEVPPTSSPKPASPVPRPAHHSMPAMLPFHGVKKVQALPKSAAQTRTIPSLLSRPPTLPPTSSSAPPPAKKPATPTTILHSTLKGPSTNPQPNSLKKLVADLKTAQQKDLKTENMLSSLKRSNENKLLSDTKKSFVGLDIRPVESKKAHEVSTS